MRWWDGLSHAGFDALLGAAAIAQRALIYFPDSTRPEPDRRILPNVTPVRLETADGLSLLAWHQAPRRADAPTLVYFHGNARHMGVRTEKIAPYLNAGYGGLLTSWRGFSGNPGRGRPSKAFMTMAAPRSRFWRAKVFRWSGLFFMASRSARASRCNSQPR